MTDLAINIGNSNISVGLRIKDGIVSASLPINSLTAPGILIDWLENLINRHIPGESIRGSILASVVPHRTQMVLEAVRAITGTKPREVTLSFPFLLDFSSYDMGRLGIDRAVCCESALAIAEPPFVMADYGTATTINVVDAHKRFLGGIILPGIEMGLQALYSNTAQLPLIQPQSQIPLIGQNTGDCIASGAIYGNVALLEGVLTKIWKQLNRQGHFVITGGAADALRPFITVSHIYRPNLLLEGLFLLYDRL